MECTQRIECTQQEEGESFCNRTCPKQIGYLGICGTTHPLYKGPNKIGRDPKTCSIVLDDNSISRHHAVINIINDKEFMVIDLGASNKTKVMGVALQPYLPHPLKNGDTVQFGHAFGIFRLLVEDDDDLPMTQAVPETPVRQVARLNIGATIVPESPDVSDRDDSIIVQSQKEKTIKNTNNNFIKSSGNTIGIQPVGTNKIDNVYWSSSRKSESFTSNFEPNSSIQLGKQSASPEKLSTAENIFDMDTQVPSQVLEEIKEPNSSIPIEKRSVALEKTSQNNILKLDTQPPSLIEDNKTSDSICNTPIQNPRGMSSLVHSLEKQASNIENLPDVYRVQDQSNVQLNLYSTKNENNNVFEAKSQEKENVLSKPSTSLIPKNDRPNTEAICSVTGKNLDNSDEIILFDEIENNSFEDCESQPIVLPSLDLELMARSEEKVDTKNKKTVNSDGLKDTNKPGIPIIPQDDEETDCEDNMIELAVKENTSKICSDDDVTDCEDNVTNDKQNEANKTSNNESDKHNVELNDKRKTPDDDVTDCEDDDIIEISQNRTKAGLDDFENLPTQVIEVVNTSDVPFEDMLTQVIQECPGENIDLYEKKGMRNPLPSEELETQVIEIVDDLSQAPIVKNDDIFKVPVSSPKLKRKNVSEVKKSITPKTSTPVQKSLLNEKDDPNYYAATQEIFNDLCSQREPRNLTRDNEKIESNISVSSNTQIREETKTPDNVSPPSAKNCNDGSKAKISPKKFTPSKIFAIDIPNSQEIDACKFVHSEPDSDPGFYPFEDSQVMENIEERPSNFPRRKKREIKQNLSKMFDIQILPTRAITRIRKPTSKLADSDDASRRKSEKILQSRLGLDDKLEADSELIQLNLARLRKKMERESTTLASSKRISNDSEKRQNLESHHKPIEEKFEEKKEKVLKLKQPTIKAMLKETKAENTKIDDNDWKENKREEDSSSKHRNRSKTRTKVNITPEITVKSERKAESRDRSQTSSRNASEKEPVLRRSRRKQAEQETGSNKSEKDHRNISKSKESYHQNDARGSSDKSVEAPKSTRSSRSNKRQAAQSSNEHAKKSLKENTNHNQNKTHDSSSDQSINAKVGEKESHKDYKERKSSRNYTKARNSSKQVVDKSIENTSENDQSTVYDLSSDKSDTSKEITNLFRIPRAPSRNTASVDQEQTSRSSERIKYSISLKRQASSIGSSRSKRSKTSANNTLEGSSTRGIKNHYVLFTAFPVESVKDKLEKFGAHIVEDVRLATVVLTLQIKRTFKLLCAIGLGKPIVGPNWVQACVDSGMIVDPWLYLMQDEQSEKRFGFNLAQSLTCPRNFLAGCNVSCTPKVLPGPQELQTIIECSGGTWKEGGSRWYCITCPDDKHLIPALKQRGAIMVTNEFALTGVLRQKLFAKPYK